MQKDIINECPYGVIFVEQIFASYNGEGENPNSGIPFETNYKFLDELCLLQLP